MNEAVGNLSEAVTLMAYHCCPVPQNCTQFVRSSLNNAIVSGRDARLAAELAVGSLGSIMTLIAANRKRQSLALSCSQAMSYESMLQHSAKLSLSAANLHENILNHTGEASRSLSDAVEHTLKAREELHAQRKSQHLSSWGQTKELFGFSDNLSTQKALEEYTAQKDTAAILKIVLQLTVRAVAIFEAQIALWLSVATDIQRLRDDVHRRSDVAKRGTDICIDSATFQAMDRDLSMVIQKAIATDD